MWSRVQCPPSQAARLADNGLLEPCLPAVLSIDNRSLGTPAPAFERQLPQRPRGMAPELRHKVEERAYALWEADGRPDGRALDYWLQAEQEIVNQSVAGEEDPLAGIDQKTS